MILLIIDVLLILIFCGILALRKKQDWQSLYNDYEFMESLPKEKQQEYWNESTRLDKYFFISLFLIINVIFLLSHFIWICIAVAVVSIVCSFAWYFINWRKLKQKYQKTTL